MADINVTATTVGNGQDVIRFTINEKPYDVSLTTDTGNEDLKSVFEALLRLMLSENVKLVFTKTDGYTNKMYEEVCREYVASIQKEIDTAQQALANEGITNKVSVEAKD